MIDLNIGKTFNQEPSKLFSFSGFASMPRIKLTDVLLADLEYYFDNIVEQFKTVDKNNNDIQQNKNIITFIEKRSKEHKDKFI